MGENLKEQQSIERIQWLGHHCKTRYSLTDPAEGVTPEQFLEILEEVEEAGYEDYLFLLMLQNETQYFVGQVLYAQVVDCLVELWRKNGLQQTCTQLREKIQVYCAAEKGQEM